MIQLQEKSHTNHEKKFPELPAAERYVTKSLHMDGV